MRQGDAINEAAIGFVVKSGWACAVLLSDAGPRLRVLDSRSRIDLSDPASPESRQPYHAGFGTARADGAELARLVAGVERFGRKSVADLIQEYRAGGFYLRGAGLVVGSLIDPERIANQHIRIHALEGQLFRRVVEEAAAASELACSVWRERDLYTSAVGILNRSDAALRVTMAECGTGVAGPWRAEQKAAALAAWLVLGGVQAAGRPRPIASKRPARSSRRP